MSSISANAKKFVEVDQTIGRSERVKECLGHLFRGDVVHACLQNLTNLGILRTGAQNTHNSAQTAGETVVFYAHLNLRGWSSYGRLAKQCGARQGGRVTLHVPITVAGMKTEIRLITVAEAFDSPAFEELCNEYRSESLRNPHMLGALPDREGYARMVQAGVLHPLGAFADGQLVGLCTVLVTPVLHFGGKSIATTETLFVAQAYRAGGLGMQLLRMAELVVLLPQGKTNRMQAR